jgi:hypothetical protein
LQNWRFGGTPLLARLGKKSAVRHASALIAELGREKNLRFEFLSGCVQEFFDWGIEGCFGRRGACGTDVAKVGEVIGDAVERRHAPPMIA